MIVYVLLTGDLYEIELHGMERLVGYHKGIEKGRIKADAKPEIVFKTPVSAVIEGNDGIGHFFGGELEKLTLRQSSYNM